MPIGKCHLTQVRPAEATRYTKGNKIATINRYISYNITKSSTYKTFPYKRGQWYSHSGKQVRSFLKKLSMQLPWTQQLYFCILHPKEMKIYVHAKIGTWMFITSLFITAPNWKQFICPSMVKQTGRYIHTTEYYLTVKRNKLDISNNLDESPENYTKWKKSNLKRF